MIVYCSGLPDPLLRILPEPNPDLIFKLRSGRIQSDPDPKYFKFYVVLLKNELINFNYYNAINK